MLMLMLVAWNFGYKLGREIPDAAAEFEMGYEVGAQSERLKDIISTSVSVRPRDKRVFADSIYNETTGHYCKMNINAVDINAPQLNNYTCYNFEIFLAIVAYIAMIVFWIYFINVIFMVNYDDKEIFTRKLEHKLMIAGISLAIYGICIIICSYIDLYIARDIFSFADYRIVANNTDSFIMLVIAVGIIMVSQIFGIARRLREEQELTI